MIGSASRSLTGTADEEATTSALLAATPPPLPTSVAQTLTGTDGDDVFDVGSSETFVEALGGDDIINYIFDLSGPTSPPYVEINGGLGFDTFSYAGLVLGAEDQGFFDMGSLGVFDTVLDNVGSYLDISNNGSRNSVFFTDIESVIGSDYDDYIISFDDFESGLQIQRIDAGGGDDYILGYHFGTVLIGGAGADPIAAREDGLIASYETAASGVNVSLARNATFGTGDADGDVFELIAQLRGSQFADTLEGDANDNVLEGLAGADDLWGGEGLDQALYRLSNRGVTINLLRGEGRGGHAEGDTLESVENVEGSGFRDVLIGDFGSNVLNGGDGNDVLNGLAGDDTLFGGAGNDVLVGGAGNDMLDGESGFDTVTYIRSAEGVDVVLFSRNESGDSFWSVERVIGSRHDDSLVGGSSGDILLGMDGADTIDGGRGNDCLFGGEGDDSLLGREGDDILHGGAGADELLGGEGFDTASYRRSAEAVTVDLLAGTGAGGEAEGDTLAGVEKILGSEFGDTLMGGDGGSQLFGYGGNDRLEGGSGNDLLLGGAGDDSFTAGGGTDFMRGGAGADTFMVMRSDSGRTVVYDFNAGAGDRIDVSDLGADFDTLAEIEAAATNAGSTVIINFGGARLQLLGLQVEDLTADMFDFGDIAA